MICLLVMTFTQNKLKRLHVFHFKQTDVFIISTDLNNNKEHLPSIETIHQLMNGGGEDNRKVVILILVTRERFNFDNPKLRNQWVSPRRHQRQGKIFMV